MAGHPLTWLLRHGAPEAGLNVDSAGWAALSDVAQVLRMTETAILAEVAEDRKARFQVDGRRIRACQGHSAAMPVTLEALEASWSPATDERGWHGTSVDAALLIASSGISPMDRTHVHLADAPDAKVGKRAGVAVLLGVRLEPGAAWRSPNGVLLVRSVPAERIDVVQLVTRDARARRDELGAAWGPAVRFEG